MIATDEGAISTTADNGDGTYTATLTSPTTSGTATLTSTIDGMAAQDTQSVTFTPGAASLGTSTIKAVPTTLTADGTSTATVTAQLKDANGNNLTTSGGTVVIATDAGTVGPTTDHDDGTYTATLTSATTTGTATVTFAVNGTDADDHATATFTPGAADPGTSTITADPNTIPADATATSTVEVRLKDANGNNLTTSGGTVLIATTAGTVGATTDNTDGTYSATLTSATTAGTASLSFTVNGEVADDTDTVRFTAGGAVAGTSTISASAVELAADGAATSTITVQAFDANGNPVASGGATVTIASTAGTLTDVVDNKNGTYTATLTAPTTAGQATVSFTLDGDPGGNAVVVTFTPGVPSPAQSAIDANPDSITADGSSTSVITVRLRDAFGNDLTTGGADVEITSDAGAISATSDLDDGTFAATLTSGTRLGVAILAFTIDGAAASETATVTFVPGAADPGASTITASPDSIVADGSSTAAVTVRLKDAQGNPLAGGGAHVRMSTTSGSLGPITDNGDATCTATLTSATAAGTATLAFTVNGADGAATETVEFIVGAADPANSEIAADPTTGVEADGQVSSLVTVTLRDGQGNQLPSGGDDVTVTSTRGTPSDVVDHEDGTYTSRLTSTTPGTAVVRFAVNGQDGTTSTSVAFVDTTAPAPPVITAPADGSSVRPDVPISGTGEPGASVAVSAAAGDPVCSATENEARQWTCFPESPLPTGEVTLSATQTDASANASAASEPVTVTVDDTKPAPPKLDPTDGATITGTAEPGSVITVRDSGGNVVCTTTTRPDGTFSCVPDGPLPAGLLLSGTATDEAGNVSDASRVRVGGPSVQLELEVVEQGAQRQVATGRGFLPAEAVSGTLESTPIDLGTRTADAGGGVTFTIDLPAGLSLGEHTVTLTGESSGAVAARFRVTAAEVPPEPSSPPQSSPSPRPSVPPSTVPVDSGLPNTGSPVTAWLIAAAVGCLVGGGALVAVSRRRRTSHDA